MRIDYHQYPAVQQAMSGMRLRAEDLGLEPALYELVKVRASQINGCAHCLEMHTKDAVALGESHDRLHLVATWEEAPRFTERERAALLWTEELTRLANTGARDEAYDTVRAVFSEEEIVGLTIAIVAINSWNRFAVGFRAEVGNYVSRHAAALA
jgi:AhpD family alkylhydroperoxidase